MALTVFRFQNRFLLFMATFIFLALISSLPEGINKRELYALIRIFILFMFTIAFYNIISPKNIYKFIVAISIPLIVNGYVIIKIFLGVDSLIDLISLYRMKVAGLGYNANSAGFLFLLGIPVWISIMLWFKNKKVILISFLVASLLTAALILTGARASILGLIVAIFFLFYWRKKLKYFFGILTVLLILAFSSPRITNLFFIAARVDRGTTSRDVIWVNTLEIIENNILFGVGIGNYSQSYGPYLLLAYDKGFVKKIAHAHNFVLAKTAELGIFGFVWVMMLYYLPIKYGYKALKKSKFDGDKAIIYGLMATLLGVYAQSIFEASGILQEARFYPEVLFWMLFAIILKAAVSPVEKDKGIFG